MNNNNDVYGMLCVCVPFCSLLYVAQPFSHWSDAVFIFATCVIIIFRDGNLLMEMAVRARTMMDDVTEYAIRCGRAHS